MGTGNCDIHDPFSGLLGQKRARSFLRRSLVSGRIAHAYLFRGPDGVGKKRFAFAMAKALNCRDRGPVMWCDSCPSCKKFTTGNHPDFHVESPDKGAIKIDRVREIAKSLTFPPYESERRVVVMEDVHTMRAEAANSLLKTLEEPPGGNILILTAETSKHVLQTIVSRCQGIPFYALSYGDTAEILKSRLGLDEEAALLLARLAEGSPGRAETLMEKEMVDLWKKVIAFLSDSRNKSDRQCGTLLQLAEEIALVKEHLPTFFSLLRLWLRDILIENYGSGEALEDIFIKLKAIDRAERELARNCNRALVCEILLFRLQ